MVCMRKMEDLVRLIREEEVYAKRIRDALVFNESSFTRPPVKTVAEDDADMASREALYSMPPSAESVGGVSEVRIVSRGGREKKKKTAVAVCKSAALKPDHDGSDDDYTNPPIDTRRVVDESDSLYSSSGEDHKDERLKLPFTYAELVALQEGGGGGGGIKRKGGKKKRIDARTLRRVANLWGLDSKLRKSEMIAAIMFEYARKFPQEVKAYLMQNSSGSSTHQSF